MWPVTLELSIFIGRTDPIAHPLSLLSYKFVTIQSLLNENRLESNRMNFPLLFESGHIFLLSGDDAWLLDTGSPVSFGRNKEIAIHGERFEISSSYMGLNSEVLTDFIGRDTVGILGVDVLNLFDINFDFKKNIVSFFTNQNSFDGITLTLDEFMEIPIVEVSIGGVTNRMFFDTGAQISYWQDDGLIRYPKDTVLSDFYPGFGQFDVQTHLVDCELGTLNKLLRIGSLPGILGMTLMMAGVGGILGNEILDARATVYQPRSKRLVFL